MTQRGFVEVFQQMFGNATTPSTAPASKPQPPQASQPSQAAGSKADRQAENQAILEEIDRMERLIAEELKRQGIPNIPR